METCGFAITCSCIENLINVVLISEKTLKGVTGVNYMELLKLLCGYDFAIMKPSVLVSTYSVSSYMNSTS